MHEIIWSNRAEQKYNEELLYWLNRNQSNEYPLKIINEVDRVEKILINNPYIGRVTDVKDIRFFPILRKFLLYYQVTENIIHILAFINADTNERL